MSAADTSRGKFPVEKRKLVLNYNFESLTLRDLVTFAFIPAYILMALLAYSTRQDYDSSVQFDNNVKVAQALSLCNDLTPGDHTPCRVGFIAAYNHNVAPW